MNYKEIMSFCRLVLPMLLHAFMTKLCLRLAYSLLMGLSTVLLVGIPWLIIAMILCYSYLTQAPLQFIFHLCHL